MDAETVDKADPTNSNVYVGNLSAEARPAHVHRCRPGRHQGAAAACRSQTPLILGVDCASGLQRPRPHDLRLCSC